MRPIASSFSHVNLINKRVTGWAKPVPLEKILDAEPKKVNTYDELVKDVAQISYRCRNLVLFYRGQNIEHFREGRSSVLPSIYRKKKGEKKLMLKARFIELKEKTEALKKEVQNSKTRIAGTLMLNKYPEIAWSLLQHYGVYETPLIDLTHSLHVACSFAFDNNPYETGIVYIIGMPWQNDAISYYTYEELVCLRLLSVCPPSAQRPFFQEGYLAGPFPNYDLDDTERVPLFDFSRRLIAKFEIPIKDKNFWGLGFDQIPHDKLYQPIDPVAVICAKLKI